MRLPDDPAKFTSQFRYVELGRFLPSKNRLTREMNNGQPALFKVDIIPEYIERVGETGIYASVFQYNSDDLHNATSLGPLYFDLDADDLELSKSEAFKLVDHLSRYITEGAIRLYFSGGKGFHVECEPLALGISPSDGLPAIYRFIAEDLRKELQLKTLDFNVYDSRRMWRVSGSRHQRSGLYKVECMHLRADNSSLDKILEYAEKSDSFVAPEQSFDFNANRWFREYTYQYEKSLIDRRVDQQDLVNRFLTDGTSNVRHYDKERMFDRVSLLKNCSAVKSLDNKARTEKFLTHYERLFLCSLLTYSDEAVMYLHEILSKCDDYRFEISNAHIEDWVKRREYDIGGRPFTCQKAREVGVSCSDCDKMQPRRKVVKLENGKYIETEEISMPSPLRHAYKAKDKGRYST